MPSLDEILKDTLIKIGGVSNPPGLTEFEIGSSVFAQRPSPDMNLGPAPQPIWVWDYTGMRDIDEAMPMNRVQELEVWSRTVAAMHGSDQGWMTVGFPMDWGPVKVILPQETVNLPLTQKYFVKGFMLSSGSNDGSNDWWPLKADFDQSFASVFVYDLTNRIRNRSPAKVAPSDCNDPTFMPSPNVESGELPVGSTANNSNDRHLICVVLSLVCMKERPDFEPGGMVGMGRFYPHFMIMSNKRLAESNGINATITVTRPDRAGYYGSFMNPGGTPRIMNHPDMDPVILPLLVTEPNVARGMDPLNLMMLPYWDLMFDYFLPIDYRGGATGPLPRNQNSTVVDRSRAGRRPVKGILQHLDYSKLLSLVTVAISNPAIIPFIPPPLRALGAVATKVALSRPSLQAVMFGNLLSLLQIGKVTKGNLLPRVKTDLVKLAGQGTFDNVHMAPRMKADKVIGTTPMADPNWKSSLDTLDTIRMAPFCEHDCMHTHWRWGAAFKDHPAAPNQQPLRGFTGTADARFTGTGKPYQAVGDTMVPLNQDLDIAFGSNSQLVYSAQISNVAPGVWQPVHHHGSAYVLGFSTVGGAAHVVAKGMVGGSQEDSELYWNMRYQAAADGALERIIVDPFDLQRAMTAANTIRLHLKVFEEPAAVSIEAMLANAKALLNLHNIDLVEVSRETLMDADEISRLRTLVVDQNVPTDDQTELFNFRGEAEPDDLAIYFVRTLVPTQAGCSAHPPDKPGAIISASIANEWTLAHQIGHVLGLNHVDGVNRLMTRRSTSTIEVVIPEIVESEVATMMDSPFNKV
jgi:hypothetical protein